MAWDRLQWVSPMLAATNFSRSLAVERSAPAPASVGRSQFLTGAPNALWPVASRAFSSGDSVMRVLLIPSGWQILSSASAS